MPADGQSQPGSAGCPAALLVHAIKSFKYALLMSLGNSRAQILNSEYKMIPFVNSKNGYFGIIAAVADCIVQKISEDLRQRVGFGNHG